MTEEILTPILIGVAIVLLVVLIIAAIEIIRTVRKVRTTVDDVMPSLSDAVTKINGAIETLEPSLKRVDPLFERISLTVDAVNLELMRADQILADISDVTDVASGTAKRVSGITDAPLNLLTSATDKIRSVFSDKKSGQDIEKAPVGEQGAHASRNKSTKAERVAKFAPRESTENTAPLREDPVVAAAAAAAAEAAAAAAAPAETVPASGTPVDVVPVGAVATPLVQAAFEQSSGDPTLLVGSHAAPEQAPTPEQSETPVNEPVAQPEPVLEQVALSIEQQVEVATPTPASQTVSNPVHVVTAHTKKSVTPPPGAASTPPPSIPRSGGTAPPRW